MTGYCRGCGNTLCVCSAVAAEDAKRYKLLGHACHDECANPCGWAEVERLKTMLDELCDAVDAEHDLATGTRPHARAQYAMYAVALKARDALVTTEEGRDR